MTNIYDITEFGAVGDGVFDCTTAIQNALDEAGKTCGCVIVPPGNYKTGYLKMREKTSLSGYHAWSFRNNGLSTLILNDPSAPCLLDITGAFGCSVRGVCFNGEGLGKNIHGVSLDWEKYNGGGQEDTPALEDCRVGGFTGNGVNLRHIWCFSIRHCQLYGNRGHGLFADGWDGFVLDNWFSGNGGAGMAGGGCIASITATANRVEWNGLAGFLLHNANSINVTGNYFDRTYGPAIDMFNDGEAISSDVTVTGNVFYRSGKPRSKPFENKYESAHIIIRRCVNTVITGNTFHVGRDDGGDGFSSPEYGIVYGSLKSSIIKDNVMGFASYTSNLEDLGDNREGVIVEGNVGDICPDRERPWQKL